jgi:hypothetical protein
LSYAWGRAFLMAMGSGKDLMPLTISLGGFKSGVPTEDKKIRQALDLTLDQSDKYNCAISATTIFPFKYWNLNGRPHVEAFSKLYITEYLPRLRARDRLNLKGTYFERMIAFGGVRGKDGNILNETKNQLQHIISLWPQNGEHPRPKQSSLQIACFDPVKDLNRARRGGFPCLQQVSLTYDDSGGLALNAYYPTQYVFDRAYGNYLGLCSLGYFMASEMDLELVRMNCFIGRPELGGINKSALRNLEKTVRGILPTVEVEEARPEKEA